MRAEVTNPRELIPKIVLIQVSLFAFFFSRSRKINVNIQTPIVTMAPKKSDVSIGESIKPNPIILSSA